MPENFARATREDGGEEEERLCFCALEGEQTGLGFIGASAPSKRWGSRIGSASHASEVGTPSLQIRASEVPFASKNEIMLCCVRRPEASERSNVLSLLDS